MAGVINFSGDRLCCPFVPMGVNELSPFCTIPVEMTNRPSDPRSVCNFMLDVAEGPISNLALQKLLYFAHGLHLVETKKPMVSGYFEAWEYGPVHPTAYKAFKGAGASAITFRAERVDPLTGGRSPLPPVEDVDARRRIRRIVSAYDSMTAGQLVDVSHAKDGPWDYIVRSAENRMAFGLRIPDELIIERFRYHKVSVGVSRSVGEPHEDTPFAGHRSR